MPPLDLTALGTQPLDHTGSGIASEGSNAAKPPRENGKVSQENGGLVRRKSSKKLFKSLSNPFKEFIQPSQTGAELSSPQHFQVWGCIILRNWPQSVGNLRPLLGWDSKMG